MVNLHEIGNVLLFIGQEESVAVCLSVLTIEPVPCCVSYQPAMELNVI